MADNWPGRQLVQRCGSRRGVELAGTLEPAQGGRDLGVPVAGLVAVANAFELTPDAGLSRVSFSGSPVRL